MPGTPHKAPYKGIANRFRNLNHNISIHISTVRPTFSYIPTW